MRKYISVTLLAMLVIVASCSKKSTDQPGTPLSFNSLTAADTVVKVNAVTTITADATGDGLTYEWTASYGNFFGSGHAVEWSVCHQATFTITCKVKDSHNNSASKTISVRSQ
jgi:hypothetical protein